MSCVSCPIRAVNRTTDDRWQIHCQRLHVQKVEQVRPAIDVSVPHSKVLQHMIKGKSKKDHLKAQRRTQVHRDNQLLLKKILSVKSNNVHRRGKKLKRHKQRGQKKAAGNQGKEMTNKRSVPHEWSSSPRPQTSPRLPSQRKAKEKYHNIQQENHTMLRRILSAKPTISRKTIKRWGTAQNKLLHSLTTNSNNRAHPSLPQPVIRKPANKNKANLCKYVLVASTDRNGNVPLTDSQAIARKKVTEGTPKPCKPQEPKRNHKSQGKRYVRPHKLREEVSENRVGVHPSPGHRHQDSSHSTAHHANTVKSTRTNSSGNCLTTVKSAKSARASPHKPQGKMSSYRKPIKGYQSNGTNDKGCSKSTGVSPRKPLPQHVVKHTPKGKGNSRMKNGEREEFRETKPELETSSLAKNQLRTDSDGNESEKIKSSALSKDGTNQTNAVNSDNESAKNPTVAKQVLENETETIRTSTAQLDIVSTPLKNLPQPSETVKYKESDVVEQVNETLRRNSSGYSTDQHSFKTPDSPVSHGEGFDSNANTRSESSLSLPFSDSEGEKEVSFKSALRTSRSPNNARRASVSRHRRRSSVILPDPDETTINLNGSFKEKKFEKALEESIPKSLRRFSDSGNDTEEQSEAKSEDWEHEDDEVAVIKVSSVNGIEDKNQKTETPPNSNDRDNSKVEVVSFFQASQNWQGPRQNYFFSTTGAGTGYYYDTLGNTNLESAKLEFIPASRFNGPKAGYVFGTTRFGLGYYKDQHN